MTELLAQLWADYSDLIIWVIVCATLGPFILREPKDKRGNK